MNVIESNPFGPLDPTALAAFEAELRGSLPADYRAFLLQHNGPLVEPTEFRVADYCDSIDEHFYGLHSEAHRDLRELYLQTPDEFPSDLFPIAEDGGGNYVCVGLGGRFGSRVYFLDHELFDEDDDTAAVIQIAESFNQFLDGLFEYNEDDEVA